MKLGRPEKLSPMRRAALAHDYRTGWTTAKLCWAYQVSICTVYRYLASEGVPLRAPHSDKVRAAPTRRTLYSCPSCGMRATDPAGHPRCRTAA